MRRLRARALGCSVVAVVALAPVAYGDLTVTPLLATSGPIPVSTPALVLFSIRNTGTSDVTINSLTPTPNTADCQAQSITFLGPAVLAAGHQVQIEVDAGSGYPTVLGGTCHYTIDSTPALGHTIDASFIPSSTPETAELQPSISDFGTLSTFEIQTVDVINYGAGSQTITLSIVNDPANAFSFPGCGGGDPHLCTTTISQAQSAPISVECTSVQGSHTAQLKGTSGGVIVSTFGMLPGLVGVGQFGMTTLQCAGTAGTGTITVAPTSLTIATGVGIEGSAPVMVDFTGASDTMVGAELTGPDSGIFRIVDGTCQTPQTCDYSAMPVALPAPMTIACTPTDTTTRTAQLTVHGSANIADAAFATITCNPNSSSPIIAFSALAINAGSPNVNAPSTPQPLTITNLGAGTLTAHLQIPTPASNEWTADACVTSACNLVGTGSAVTVNITLTPNVHGNRGASLIVTSNDTNNPSQPITLAGSGIGGVLTVTNPTTPFSIDFGTLPRNQPASLPVTMLDGGNANLTVTVTSPAAPFSVNATTVNLGSNGGTGTFMATCGSATSGGPFTGQITLASSAYQSNTTAIDVRCSIADTDVQVAPTSFDFGEVRVSSAPVPMTVTVTNPTSGDVTLAHMQLDASRPGLSLTPSDTSTTIPSHGMVMATIALDPMTETDLEGVHLAIAVDNTNLSFPLHGKVVTPAAHVVPTALDLGTACLGSQVTGMVALVNDGTATLNPSPPMMDQSFTALFVSPTSYPTPLPPMLSAVVGITPSSSVTGPLHGMLTWAVDAPNSPFVVPVSLEYIDTGAAVSPSNLDFGELEVGMTSTTQTVTLENCNTTPVTVTTHGVVAAAGTIDAWKVDPQEVYPALAPHDTIKLQVGFAPQHAGHYDAQLQYDVDGTTGGVQLLGDGHGGLVATSFYACSCSGPGAPAQGWPVGAAIVLVVVRRRRRR